MPESSRVVRRALVTAGAVAIAAGLTGGLAGCAKFDAALGQQWVNVDFQQSASIPTMLKVRAACSHIPNVTPEALPHPLTLATMGYEVTYSDNKATVANMAKLQKCVQRFPSVAGIDPEDSSDDGG